MKRLFALLLALPMLASIGLVGCGEKKPTPAPTPPGGGTSRGKGPQAAVNGAAATIKPGDGKVIGRVVYDGTAPKPGRIPELDKHEDAKQVCHKGPEEEQLDQTWIVGKDGGVANAVIWLAPASKDSKFEVVESKGAVTVDQPHCAYVPHVVAIKPGQYLEVKNSAPVNHNTKWDADSLAGNEPGGKTIAPKGSIPKIDLKPQDSPIRLGCDIHKFMIGYVWVMPHQYVAVTDKDGKFTIENVPTDTELSVVAWHEAAGYFHGGKKGMKHTFKSGETNLGDLKVKAQ